MSLSDLMALPVIDIQFSITNLLGFGRHRPLGAERGDHRHRGRPAEHRPLQLRLRHGRRGRLPRPPLRHAAERVLPPPHRQGRNTIFYQSSLIFLQLNLEMVLLHCLSVPLCSVVSLAVNFL